MTRSLFSRRSGTAPVGDLAPLQRRLDLLQVLRLVLAGAAALIALALPGPLGGHGPPLAALSLVYAAASGSVELARRRLGLPTGPVVAGLVLVDGLYLAAAMALSGGPQSVLAFLVLVHVIGVTLLLSFRYGLKAGLWHALLLFISSWLQQAGVVRPGPVASPGQAAVLGALALLAVALAAAGFSSLNEGALRRGKAQLHALAEMARRMAETREPTGLVHALLTGVGDAFGFGRAAVVLRHGPQAEGRVFRLGPDGTLDEVVVGGPVGTGPAQPHGEPRRSAPVPRDQVAGPGMTGTAPSLVRALDGRHDPLLAAALPGATNVVVAPLVVDGQWLGTLALERGGRSGLRITARTVDLLAQFAAHAGLALRASALRAEVERLADTDALTSLPNRRAFQEALARELAVATRRGEPCALIVLDVDHFKAVNDTYGHPAGDDVLRLVGRALADTARATDVAARYGGEEFVVVVPGCSSAAAMAVAERFRAAVAAGSGQVRVTVSAGVAAFPADAADPAELVASADAALYRAKRLGRDRSVRYRRARFSHRPRPRRRLAA